MVPPIPTFWEGSNVYVTFPQLSGQIYLWLSQRRTYVLIGQHVVPRPTLGLGTLWPGWWEDEADRRSRQLAVAWVSWQSLSPGP